MLAECGFKNIQIKPATGLLDKIAWMVSVLAFKTFSTFKRKNEKSSAIPTRNYLAVILPVYRLLNFIYAFFVKLESVVIPMALASSVLVVAKKDEDHA